MSGLVERVFYSNPGQALAGKLGLPEPEVLRRGRVLPTGPVVLASLAGSAHKKPTSSVCDFLSAYSISNSAKDEPQSKHQ